LPLTTISHRFVVVHCSKCGVCMVEEGEQRDNCFRLERNFLGLVWALKLACHLQCVINPVRTLVTDARIPFGLIEQWVALAGPCFAATPGGTADTHRPFSGPDRPIGRRGYLLQYTICTAVNFIQNFFNLDLSQHLNSGRELKQPADRRHANMWCFLFIHRSERLSWWEKSNCLRLDSV
jgi:hypothetical protein